MTHGPIHLTMGPWVHNACTRSYAGDAEFGPTAALDGATGPSIYDLQRRWFDRWLKDEPNGAEDDPPVRLFVMGGGDGRRTAEGRLNHGGRWRAEADWPLVRARVTTYYLHHDGRLAPELPGAADPPLTFRFDPMHPVPTISGNMASFYEHLPVPEGIHPSMSPPRARMRPIVPQGASHQQERPDLVGCRPPYPPLAARPDVLVFQTPPLAAALEITGPITLRLWVASSAVDTDITAKLVDVYPSSPTMPAATTCC
jgi:predicted acyl esterase